MGITKFTPKSSNTGSERPMERRPRNTPYPVLYTPPDSPIFGSAPRVPFSRKQESSDRPPYPVNDHDLFALARSSTAPALTTPPESPPLTQSGFPSSGSPPGIAASRRFPHLIRSADTQAHEGPSRIVTPRTKTRETSPVESSPEIETDPRKLRQKHKKGKKQENLDKSTAQPKPGSTPKEKKKKRKQPSPADDAHNINYLKWRGAGEDTDDFTRDPISDHLRRRDAGVLGSPAVVTSSSSNQLPPGKTKVPKPKKKSTSSRQNPESRSSHESPLIAGTSSREEISSHSQPRSADSDGPLQERRQPTSGPSEHTTTTRRRDRTKTRPRRASLDTIPSIPPPMDEYNGDSPPYRERLHKRHDLISFDPRYHIPVLRVNRALIKSEKFLESSITKFTRHNILPSEIDLWGLNHIDDTQFHNVIPMLLSDHDSHPADRPPPDQSLTEEEQLNYALQMSALEAEIQPESHGFRYNSSSESAREQHQPQHPACREPPTSRTEQTSSQGGPVRHSPGSQSPTDNNSYSAQLFRSLNNNPLFSGFRYNPPSAGPVQADSHSLYSQNSLNHVEPV